MDEEDENDEDGDDESETNSESDQGTALFFFLLPFTRYSNFIIEKLQIDKPIMSQYSRSMIIFLASSLALSGRSCNIRFSPYSSQERHCHKFHFGIVLNSAIRILHLKRENNKRKNKLLLVIKQLITLFTEGLVYTSLHLGGKK